MEVSLKLYKQLELKSKLLVNIASRNFTTSVNQAVLLVTEFVTEVFVNNNMNPASVFRYKAAYSTSFITSCKHIITTGCLSSNVSSKFYTMF